ncbi:hypothetical protein [Primorskyibacter sedentarius]|uniref:hypothetical protein n=1 Tax=Primorskyibacter sedentarius TaxID=745311 RepID=UPI003EB6BAF6
MTTDVDICNMALLSLGESKISALSDQTTRATVCSLFYAPVRDAVLESFPWNFATFRAALTLDASAPLYDFANQYDLSLLTPTCLRVLDVEGDTVKWRREGSMLLSDEDSLNARYIGQVTDENDFTPTFVLVFAARLAAEIAYPITKSRTKEEQAWKLYELKEIDAFGNQSQEGSLDDVDESDVLIGSRG